MTFTSIYGKNACLITMNKCTIKSSQQCTLQCVILVVSLSYHNTVHTLSDYVLTCILHVRCCMYLENMNLIISLPDLYYCMCVHFVHVSLSMMPLPSSLLPSLSLSLSPSLFFSPSLSLFPFVPFSLPASSFSPSLPPSLPLFSLLHLH